MLWTNDPRELLNVNSLHKLVPSLRYDLFENINIFTRISIVIGLILSLLFKTHIWLLLPVFAIAFSFIVERFENKPPKDNQIKNNLCTKPTNNNPFMNVTLNEFTENPNRGPACHGNAILEEARDIYYQTLPRDADDIHNKKASDRAFYTMPNTQIPSDQDAYLKFLYGDLTKEKNKIQNG
jgi:hypothetical protein